MRPLWLVFLIAVAARVGGQVILGAYLHPETWEYEVVASNLLAGRGYTYAIDGATYVASQSSPLYIVLTGLVYLVTGHSQAAMLALQALLGGLTAVACAWLASTAAPARPGSLSLTAWLAGGVVAVDPGLVIYSAKLHSLTLDALLFSAVVCALIVVRTRPDVARLAVVGAVAGLSGLSRASALVLLPLQLLWLRALATRRLTAPAVVACLAVAALVYAPWPIRNSVLLGQFVPSSSESSEWLWRGNNPAASGSSWTSDGRLMLDVAPADFRARIAAASEGERIALYRDAALQFIGQHPFQALWLFGVKLRSFWWLGDTTGLLYPAPWLAAYLVWSSLVLALFVVGCWFSLRRTSSRPLAALVLLTLVGISLAQAIFYVEGRHRLAVEPLMLVVASFGVAELVPARERARRLDPTSVPGT